MQSCTAVAPSSTANLGPGYDVFGLALEPLKDIVTIARTKGKAGQISIKVLGEGRRNIPSRLESNSAGLVIKRIAEDFEIRDSLAVTIRKGIPPGSGLGSSAASASAAAVAINCLFGLGIENNRLVEYAAEGEVASAGIRHYDNVSASLLGGFVIVRTDPKLDFVCIDPPDNFAFVVALPSIEVASQKTQFARSVVPEKVSLKDMIRNVSNASVLVAGFATKDIAMIASGINDAVIEPSRKHLIPGYEEVKRNALQAGALAVTISGAGPSMISLIDDAKKAEQVAKAMKKGFSMANVRSKIFFCRPAKGARVLS